MTLKNLISLSFTEQELTKLDTHLAGIRNILKSKTVNLSPCCSPIAIGSNEYRTELENKQRLFQLRAAFVIYVMSRKYKFDNKSGLYFVSFVTVKWIDAFTRQLSKT